jgi:DNA-binding winged helix-turn-helix (wHTH) protein
MRGPDHVLWKSRFFAYHLPIGRRAGLGGCSITRLGHTELRFDRFTLDTSRGSLRDGDREIDLAPKPFEVLSYLAKNAGRLVSKAEIFEVVWPGVVVSDDSLVQCIGELRSKLEDEERRLIKTISRRGYRFDATVTPSDTLGPAQVPRRRRCRLWCYRFKTLAVTRSRNISLMESPAT